MQGCERTADYMGNACLAQMLSKEGEPTQDVEAANTV